ncbi:MAG: ABC transporter substrate-binding protein [Clostridia bacterium]|nr:ABC transporter substrate-binding protein [Clostridia bacterium]
MKRILGMILILNILAVFSGCAMEALPEEGSQLGAYGAAEEKEAVKIPARESISMIFYEDMDLNPLTTVNSENHELLKLVYSPLVRINDSMVAEYVLAESVANVDQTVTIKLKKDLKFSDGSKVTASDVGASFRLVRKTPSSPYYRRLENVRDYWIEGDRTIVVKLREPDVDFINCLDIPIIKRDGEVGCGPYQFSEKNGKRVLTPNKHYFETPSIKTITLKKPADEEERQDMFSVGLLDVFFLPVESELTFSGGKDYRVQTYTGDNLLYLGVNGENSNLKKIGVRQYLSGLLQRKKLVDNVLLGRGDAAAFPFQPTWYKAAGLSHEKNWSDLDIKGMAERLGFTLEGNRLLGEEGKPVSFTLLVNKESEIHRNMAAAIADHWALYGITIKVDAKKKEDYNAALAEGKYDLYLAEVKTGRTLNTALYAAESPIHFGGINAEKTELAAAQYRSGKLTLAAFGEEFEKEMPIIPLAYRQGVVLASSDIGDFQSAGTWSIYGNISKLKTMEREISK